MTDEQIFCACGETYAADLAACPKCGAQNSHTTHSSGRGVKVAAFVGIATAIIAIVFLVPEIIPLKQPSPLQMAITILQPQEVGPATVPQEELVQHALAAINGDRAAFGLRSVQLSDNQAAQVAAEDVFANKQISHWLSNGEKPYMTYSRLDGPGSVHQNVAISGFSQEEYDRCQSSFLRCEKIDPLAAIEELEYEMMYNDLECCNDGHRENILDPNHTHVSIGIMYDDYYLVIVQNFENDYGLTVEADNTDVSISGPMPRDAQLENVVIYYDPLPTPEAYEENKKMLAYGAGELAASVFEPLPPGFHYQQAGDHVVIEASSWESGGDVDVKFDMSPAIKEPGVYTLYAMFERDGEQFPATSHSIFVGSVS
ncbi:MAG: CAP domain-containing protein [Nitrososphaera sp.]|uniref:CAP domain-containing protein n=1 Tax=Nitrososphaera sp. TaxID=1971748 RepID=UPI001809CE4C|nr:CAP domain-containing protein [Nitrososphaera sp.]NWG37551.1 CAP domain-containing protein [Nitrososphaera sp.]